MASHRTGGEVDAFCTKCKLMLAHTIIAMVGSKIVRVRCNTCMGEHAFRTEGSVAAASSTGSAPARPRPERTLVSFEERLGGKELAKAPKYSPKETFAVDQVISHPTFGYGIVTAVRGDKVDVVFKATEKTLVHARGGASTPEKPTYRPPPVPHDGPADKPVSETSDE